MAAMKKWKIYRLTVSGEDKDQRLDQYLAANADDLSCTRVRKIIYIGGVHVNGRRVRSSSRPVTLGDQIELYLDHFSLDPFRFTSEDILYRDKYLLVLNKPAGIDTQPTHARYKGTVYEALQVLLQDPFKLHQKPELGMVQRLDRGTTGLMVFSTHQRAHGGLTKVFVEHRVEKKYLALVGGSLKDDEGEIRSFLARSRKKNKVISVQRGGKEAITRFQVIERYPQAALVELDLLTGRSHQIRAHMAEVGCSLLGDTRYGGVEEMDGIALDRPLLHAKSLVFLHPVKDEVMSFDVPLPRDMSYILKRLATV